MNVSANKIRKSLSGGAPLGIQKSPSIGNTAIRKQLYQQIVLTREKIPIQHAFSDRLSEGRWLSVNCSSNVACVYTLHPVIPVDRTTDLRN